MVKIWIELRDASVFVGIAAVFGILFGLGTGAWRTSDVSWAIPLLVLCGYGGACGGVLLRQYLRPWLARKLGEGVGEA